MDHSISSGNNKSKSKSKTKENSLRNSRKKNHNKKGKNQRIRNKQSTNKSDMRPSFELIDNSMPNNVDINSTEEDIISVDKMKQVIVDKYPEIEDARDGLLLEGLLEEVQDAISDVYTSRQEEIFNQFFNKITNIRKKEQIEFDERFENLWFRLQLCCNTLSILSDTNKGDTFGVKSEDIIGVEDMDAKIKQTIGLEVYIVSFNWFYDDISLCMKFL